MSLVTLIIFATQILLVFFKHVTIRALAEGNVRKAVTYTMWIQISWLTSSSLAIDAFLSHDFLNVAFYIWGGMVGSYLSFKVKV